VAVSGGIGRRFATGVAVTTAALGSFGAALAVAAVVRVHLPVLDWGERVRLVLRWTAVGALGGLGVGVAAGLLSGFVARRWVRGILVGLLVAASIVPVLLAGRRSPGVPWSALGAPQEYPPLAERRAAPGAPNLVLVTIDTLRHDHLQLYGYERPTAPHLAVLARGGTVFEAAVAQAPETLHSLASLMTGLYPHVLDKEFEDRGQAGAFIGSAFHTLAERLAAGGYDTAGFVSNLYLKQENGFGQGFRHFDDRSGMFWWGPKGRWKRAEHVVEPALAWLERAESPFFLWVHVMDPHHPYEPASAGPWEDGSRAAPHAAAYGALSIRGYTQRLKDLRAGRPRATPEELAYLVGRYDAEILQVDRELARLHQRLESRGFDERNTVLIVTADHGEEFVDHGGMLHGHSLFDELIRVPLVMRGRGIPPGKRLGGQVQLVDVTATLLDLAGLLPASGESPELDGVSLLPALAAGEPPLHAALSFIDTRYVAYRTPDWKLVAAFAPYDLGPPSWLPWEGLVSMARVALGRPHHPKIGLWHLDEDPREQQNLVGNDAVSLRTLYASLLGHRQAHPPRLVASSAGPGLNRRGRRALRALGYVQ